MHNLKRLGTAILVTGSILILFSCAKDPTEVERTPTSTFPLTTDSRWEYSGLWYTVPFNDSSLADTAQREIYRHIIGPDSLPGFDNLIVCDDTIITYASGLVDTFINRQWLRLENEKLKLFAYDEFPIGDEPTPEIYFTPRNILDLPLSRGKTWIAWISDLTMEDKRVVGVDYLELPFGWLYCDVVRSAIRISATNDTTQAAFEWYSDDGLMKVEYAYPTVLLRDNNGAVIDSANIFYNWELIDIDIQP